MSKPISSRGACDISQKAHALIDAILKVDPEGVQVKQIPISDGWSNIIWVSSRWAHLFVYEHGWSMCPGTLCASRQGAALCKRKLTVYGAPDGYTVELVT